MCFQRGLCRDIMVRTNKWMRISRESLREIVQWRRAAGWCKMASSRAVSSVESWDGSQKSWKFIVNLNTEAEDIGKTKRTVKTQYVLLWTAENVT
jgi:hypothetical protein